MPVVVLVNEYTASASEILTAALKESYGAEVVGMKTYGKGVIQTLYSLSDGSGIKITTAEYFTPEHNKINKLGITPDYEVDLTKDENGNYETGEEKDAQLLKAIEVLEEKITSKE
jgi:carboxyl-terminal processing protease